MAILDHIRAQHCCAPCRQNHQCLSASFLHLHLCELCALCRESFLQGRRRRRSSRSCMWSRVDSNGRVTRAVRTTYDILLTNSNLYAILLVAVMAASLAFAQDPVGFFPPKSTPLSPVDSALTYVLIPLGFKSSRIRTYAKPGGGVALAASILDFTSTMAYRTLSVAFPMTYATLQRRRTARILASRVLNSSHSSPSARLP